MVRENRETVSLQAPEGGFETSVSSPCVLVFRSPQRGCHVLIGVAVDDIASGGDEVWEQAITKLKQRSTCSRDVTQAADGPMSVGQPAYIKNLDVYLSEK